MALTTEAIQSIAKMVENIVGMPYREFEKLDFETQQQLMKEGRKKQSSSKLNALTNQAEVKEDFSIVEEKQEENEGEIIYSEPGAFVKKLN